MCTVDHLQGYTFITLSLTIPVTIFDLINWHAEFNRSTLHKLLSLYHVPFVVFKFAALTIIPAKVITEVSHDEHDHPTISFYRYVPSKELCM